MKNPVQKNLSKDFDEHPAIPTSLVQKLCLGKPTLDCEFDRIFPPYYQALSQRHWSSIKVANQIAEWIRPFGKKKFLDLGSGVGKMCLLMRILTDCEIYGVEQRENLVAIANTIIQANNFSDISISHSNILDLDWQDYDIYYLYNPFQEHVVGSIGIIEDNIEFSESQYKFYISEVFKRLSAVSPGKLLITFHGYGNTIPNMWRAVSCKKLEYGSLIMWKRGIE